MEQQNPTTEMTFGQKLAGISFNPSKDNEVDNVKAAAAKFMDVIHDALQNEELKMPAAEMLKQAELRALESQMLAVKAITWKY